MSKAKAETYLCRKRVCSRATRTAGFLFFCVMLYNNKKAVTTASLKASKQAIRELISESADFMATFILLQEAAQLSHCPLDKAIAAKIHRHYIAISSLLYEQEAQLKACQLRQIAGEKAQKELSRLKARSTKANPENGLENDPKKVA